MPKISPFRVRLFLLLALLRTLVAVLKVELPVTRLLDKPVVLEQQLADRVGAGGVVVGDRAGV